MRTSEKLILLQSAFSPYRLPNLAASYSLSGAASDNTYLLNAGNVQLIADQSINSRVNGLVLNGVNGNYASIADSAATSITGDIDIRLWMAAVDWTPSAAPNLLTKWGSAPQRGYGLSLSTTGILTLDWSNDGTATLTSVASVATGVTDLASKWVRVTLDVDDGAGGNVTHFYLSDDGVTWTQLGTAVTKVGTTSIFNSTAGVQVGALVGVNTINGIVYRAQIYNGIAGTLAFDANFTTVAKLATSFTESSANAATVTINTSGDLGARISGARDLVQMTAAKQPAFSVVGGYNTATFDGVNDYMGSAATSYELNGGNSIYIAVTKSSATPENFYRPLLRFAVPLSTVSKNPNALQYEKSTDGTSPNRLEAFCANTSPTIFRATPTTEPVAVKQVLASVVATNAISLFKNGILYGGATAVTGTIQSNLGQPLLICTDDSSPGSFGAYAVNEILLRSAADDATLQGQIAGVLIKKWGISLP